MTSSIQGGTTVRADVRTIVGGGLKLGVITAFGVVIFSLLTRAASGVTETLLQSVVILIGGVVCSFVPAIWVRPREVDSIAWASLIGLLGALTFTVLDIALLRPVGVYHWSWDQIGGGSGFWYLPVWWMAAAVLAWLGAWAYAVRGRSGAVSLVSMAAQTVAGAVVLFAILVITGLGSATSPLMALAFALVLVLYIPLATTLSRQ